MKNNSLQKSTDWWQKEISTLFSKGVCRYKIPYKSLVDFAEQIRVDAAELKPKDFIDLQSFIWVLGSDEYED